MKTKVFTLAALLCCASAMYAQESGYKFTTVASQKADRKSTRLNSSHYQQSRMPSSA